ncbi:MAG: UvrD-helicase domain-containing protein [Prevotella sp.]|nr:UvrD-helicase domain-containing protein [Prevotella sp.]
MVKPLTVYKASAGSGKTFTLATEYIRLLVENPLSYRSILAVTFTNKATEEMKMRILSQLYGIWKQLPDSDDYLEAIRRKTGFEPRLISERAGIALANLLHNYNYFRVETIDTFFQSVLRNMARELDLTTNLRIGLNDYQVEELAVDQLIADLSTTDIMLQWILKYIMENISEDKAWNIIYQIKNFGHTIFRDDYKAVSRDLEQKMQEEGFFDDYTRRLRELRQMALEHMKEIAESFFDTLDGEGLTIDDLANKNRGIAGFFLKLQKGVFDPGIENATVANCLENPEKWCAKTHPRRELIVSLTETTLSDILRYAVEERPRQWKLYKSADLTLRHLNQLRLLSSIEQKVHELNANANRFLLSDTQQLLHSLIGESDSPFIFEKIGTQLEHIMIDEFQDTSTVQWQNFRVLLAEAMSHENTSNLIVGDVKQSIYRWRSGDWRLLNDIEHQFRQGQIETLPLKTNYRSDRRIITFNNVFFRHAAQLEYAAQKELNSMEAEQLQRAYADVEQLIPDHREDSGYVDIRLLPADDYQAQTYQLLAQTIGDLIAQGIPQQKIAILVRTNGVIPQIANYFMQQMPEVTIVSDEAFRLDASDAVCLLVGALRLLIHPDDMLTKAALVKSYQCDVLGKHDDNNELLMSPVELDSQLPEDYTAHFSELLTLPLYDLVERLYAIFELERLQDQSAYVSAFYDRLSDYVSENATDISAFLVEWDETLCAKTIQSDETEGVRIFSIHKSKGLEYDHVVCPFCDWQLEKQIGNILWCTPTEQPFSDLPIAPIDYSQKQMTGTIYEADYLHEHLQNTVDNLNLLYVAFTRARKSLHVIGRRGAKNSRAALIEQCLPLIVDKLEGATLEGQESEDTILTFTYGTLPHSTFHIPHSTTTNPFLQPSEPLSVSVRTFSNKVDFRQSNRSQQFVEGDDEDSRQRHQYIQTGSILHEIFSTIRTVDDIPDALQRLQFEGVLYDEQISAERITSMLKKRLEHPRVRDWFSKRWTLFNECTILSVEDGQVKERRPDRVMTDGQEWIVVDFKFGSPKPEYHDQVREYMQLLASMGHHHITGYLWYVYSNRIEEIKQ